MKKLAFKMPKMWWFKCQNYSCFKQNFFGNLNAKTVASKMPKMVCFKCQNLPMKLTPGFCGPHGYP